MGMTIEEIIDGLQFTIDMFLFNPSTGEIQPKHLLNEDSRLTVDACEGAIDTMRKYQKIEQIAREGKNETRCEEIVRIIDGKA